MLEGKFCSKAPSAREDIQGQCQQNFLTNRTVFISRDIALPLKVLAAAAASGASD